MATVVITGGSRGIGAAAVELFAARGDRVVFLYEKNHEAAKAVAEKTGATPICCDVSDGKAVKAAFESIGDVDILICNAGIMHFGLLSMMEESAWDRIFDVNVKGIYTCINAAMPAFLKKHAGCVITVSSMWGQVGASCEAAYSATKGAVIALTKVRSSCGGVVFSTEGLGNCSTQIHSRMGSIDNCGKSGVFLID